MMQPKRTKFRKQFKGNLKGSSHRGSSVAFGDFALKATDRSRMTAREIEAARRAMTRYVKRGGQIWIRVFPDVPITQKPLEVRMGSGKGNVEYWVAKVTPGKVLFEIEGVPEATAREAFKLAAAKLSVSTAFVRGRCADEQEEHQGARAEHEVPARQDQAGAARRAAGAAPRAVQPAHGRGLGPAGAARPACEGHGQDRAREDGPPRDGPRAGGEQGVNTD